MLAPFFAGLALLSSAHAAETNSVVHDFDEYAKFYPSHLEYCAGTKFQFVGGSSGGNGGHAIVYVHGLCKDASKKHPQVKPCGPGDDHRGVVVSVNSDFKNVNWVAVPTHSLGFDGDIREGAKITEDEVARVSNEANAYRVFEGVRIKPELTKDKSGRALAPGSAEYLFAVARNSLGTDFGLRFARHLDCVRFPIRAERIADIAKYLNELNDSYFKTGKVYNWDGLKDNCAHVASGILHQAKIRDAIPTGRSKFASAWDSALPQNGVYTLLDIAYNRSVLPWNVYGRKEDRANLTSATPYMPSQVGVLAKRYPAFTDNAVYVLSKKVFKLPSRLGGYFLSRGGAFKNPETSEIGGNLLAWEKTYLSMLNITGAEYFFPQYAKWRLESGFVYDSKPYNAFEPHYDRYLRDQLKRVQDGMKALGLKGITIR